MIFDTFGWILQCYKTGGIEHLQRKNNHPYLLTQRAVILPKRFAFSKFFSLAEHAGICHGMLLEFIKDIPHIFRRK